MAERFVSFGGTISIETGTSVVVGTGTTFSGLDRAGAELYAYPDDAAPFVVGIVAEVDPRGQYDNLELPLVVPAGATAAYNGPTLVNARYVLRDGLALARGASQAAIYARVAARLDGKMGLVGSKADFVNGLPDATDPNSSLYVDEPTRTIQWWRNGTLAAVQTIGLAFTPRGAWDGGTAYALNDLVDHEGAVFVSNGAGNTGHEPATSPSPASDAHWTVLPLPPPNDAAVVVFNFAGRLKESETLRYVFADTTTFPAGFAGSFGVSGDPADSDAVFPVWRNDAVVGAATYAASGDTSTFSADDPTTYAPGDVMVVETPSPRDATLADVSLTFRGTRS